MAKATHSLRYSGLEGATAAPYRAVTRDFIFTVLFHITLERHNCSEKSENRETEAALKNYLPQIRELIESTVPGAVAHLCQHKRLGLAPTKMCNVQLKLFSANT